MGPSTGRAAFSISSFVILAVVALGLSTPRPLIAATAPTITTEPRNQTNLLGANATFNVVASGQTPLFYQWSFNGSNLVDSVHIGGATNATLVVSNVTGGDAGNYRVVVTNSRGSATSSNATLTVLIPASITSEPASQSVSVGSNVTFMASATGTAPLNYRWYFNSSPLTDGGRISGSTSNVLKIADAQTQDAGDYRLIVSNNYGSDTSAVAVLAVAPVPFIAGFNPAMAYPGATVTIAGTNFSPVAGSNIVYFGAVQAAVLSASVTNLVVTVPAGATFSPITETVGGLTAYANAPFLPTFFSAGIFTNTSLGPQIVLPAGSGPNKVVIADLDGDGKPDLIVSDDYGSTISVYQNISTNGVLSAASFAPPVTLATPSGTYSPWGLAVADVDGDGKPDIIATDDSQPLVSIYRNLCTPGNITSNSFAARVDLPTGNTPMGVAVRDVDGDGKPDLLVANANDGTISIFRNTGVPGSLTTNSFAPRVDFPTGAGCQDVQVADLDGDGLPDIVTANDTAGTVSVLRNLSTPGILTANSFAPAVNLSVLSEPVQIAIGDLDGDGKPDISVTFYLPQTTVSVLRNISTVGSLTSNSFAAHVDFALGGRGHTPMLADLDGSGKPDLAVVTELNSLLSIFKNVSMAGNFTSNSLAPRIDFATGYNAWGMAIGDLDGDGRPDIVFANSYDSTISIYQNQVPLGAPPAIAVQPQDETVLLGSNAAFSVSATGTQPLTYQWYFNGTNLTDNGRITGSSTGTLSISNAMLSDAGDYYLVVTNPIGKATSAMAALTVVLPATITAQPTNQTVLQSSNASFAATATGTALDFQWYFNGTPLTDGGRVSGSATTNLNIANVQAVDAGAYQLIANNNLSAATSAVATLTVLVPATIASGPTSQSVLAGSNAIFTASATGTAPLNYRWYFNNSPLTDGGRISGSTSNVLMITGVQIPDAGNYQLIVTNNYGSDTSAIAVLNVVFPATITAPPTNQTVLLSSNVSFTATAAGTALNYQWYFNGVPLTDGGGVSGSATPNLNLTNVQTNQAGSYQLVVTNVYSEASAVAVLTVVTPPTIVQQPANQTAQWGADASFSVVANGTAPLTYQWAFDGTNLAGATSSILLLTNLQPAEAGNYAVAVSNAFGSVVSSNAALTVNQPPPGVPFIASFNPAMAYPGATVTIVGTNFSSVAASNTVFFGAVQAAVVSASVTNLVVTVPAGATFSPITETVGGLTAYANAPFLPTFFSSGVFTNTSLGPQIVLPSGKGPNKVVIADLDGDGKPDLIVSDDYGSTISVYRNISANGVLGTNSFAPPVTLVTPSGTYSPWGLVVADVDGDGKPDIIVTDDSQPLVSIYRNLCTPGNISSNSFATRVDLPTGNTPLAVEVRDLDGDGKPDLLVGNANDGTISIFRNTGVPGNLTTNSFAPRVDIPTGAGCEDVKVADLDGDGLPDIVTANNGANTVSVFRNLSTPGSLTTNSFAPPVIIPVLSEPVQLAIGDLDGDGKPDIIVTFYLPQMTVSVLHNISTVGNLTANSFEAHVDFALGGRGHTPVLADLDGSGKPDLAVVTELNSLLSIFKNVSTPGSFTTSSLGPRMDFATEYNAWGVAIGDLDGDGRPDIVFANSYSNTISIYQNQVPLGGPPVIGTQPQAETTLVGSNAVFSVVVADGTQPLTYQWQFNGTNLPGATTTSLMLSNVLANQSGPYSVVVSNSYGTIISSNATLTVLPLAIAGQPQNQSVLVGATASFIVSVNGQQPFFYRWMFDGANLPSGTNNSLVLSNVSMSQSGLYSVAVSNAYGMAVSSNATLTVLPLLITTQPSSQVAWPHGFATFTVNVSGTGPFGFEWQCNGVDVPGTWANVLTLTNLQPQQFGTYRVIVSNAYGSVISSNATLSLSQVAVWGGNSGETNLPAGLTNIIAIAGGGTARFDCLALRSNGTAFHWPTTNLTTITNNFLAIVGGGSEGTPFLVLERNGTVATWLVDDIIQPISGFTNAVAIAPDIYAPLALTPNGTLVGGNFAGQGQGTPTNIVNVVAISEGSGFGMALKADHTVTVWGNNTYGQTNVPPGLSNVVAIAAGYSHALALKSDGTITAWGLNAYGQTNVPPGLSNVVAIAAGTYHSMALLANGTVAAWGYNLYGQTNVPPHLTNVVAIAAGANHSMALIGQGPPISSVLLAGPNFRTNGVSFSLPSQSGRVYVLQYENSLSGSNWNSLPLLPGNGGTLLLIDPSPTNQQRFYRVQRW